MSTASAAPAAPASQVSRMAPAAPAAPPTPPHPTHAATPCGNVWHHTTCVNVRHHTLWERAAPRIVPWPPSLAVGRRLAFSASLPRKLSTPQSTPSTLPTLLPRSPLAPRCHCPACDPACLPPSAVGITHTLFVGAPRCHCPVCDPGSLRPLALQALRTRCLWGPTTGRGRGS